MTHPVKGIDHAFLLSADLDASADAWRKLGFTLSPRGLHSAEKGTANHTIVFGDDYFELLGIVTETAGNQHQRDTLAHEGEGLRAIACRIDDARAAQAALADLGITTGEVGEFSRPLPLPDGSRGVAAFATLPFGKDEAPQGYVFMCQHKTRDMVWRPELQSHANGATGLAGIIAVSAQPEEAAKRFARLYAAGASVPIDGGFRVETGENSAPILVLGVEAARARYSGPAIDATPNSGFAVLQIRVSDLDRARQVIEAAGVSPHDGEGSFWVAPQDASGAVVEFMQK